MSRACLHITQGLSKVCESDLFMHMTMHDATRGHPNSLVYSLVVYYSASSSDDISHVQ